MLKFFTSLSFLYLLAITLIIVAAIYSRKKNAAKQGQYPKPFIWTFSLISLACMGYLWINIHAPLSLKTFSNLDHHFIQHDGFITDNTIELGVSDTTRYPGAIYNRFAFSAKEGRIVVKSTYSEEPFYIQSDGRYQIASVNFPATDQRLTIQNSKNDFRIECSGDDEFILQAGEKIINKKQKIRKGISAYNLFKEEEEFVRDGFFHNADLINCLSEIYLLRDDISSREYGQLKFFISGKLFKSAANVRYNEKIITPDQLQFEANLTDHSKLAWGLGFLSNNRNQYQVKKLGGDSIFLKNRYPVSYPLTEEDRDDWSLHVVHKFLIADPDGLHQMPAPIREGFLFAGRLDDPSFNFEPVLLNYRRGAKNEDLSMQAIRLRNSIPVAAKSERLILPARSGNHSWAFSIRNTFDWQFAGLTLKPSTWQGLIFGSLFFFFLLILLTAVTGHRLGQNRVWQLLSCLVMLMLTTRFFLYWRYKSFPPFEGMDLPSQQQLQSLSNFSVIIIAAIGLAIGFSFSFLRKSLASFARFIVNLINRDRFNTRLANQPGFVPGLKSRLSELFAGRKGKIFYFASWVILLVVGALIAALNQYDSGVCRRLAIIYVITWFLYLFIAYRHSPLVQPAERAWWRIRTTKFSHYVVSNPVKIILSVSLLAFFAFIDIGFAIVFLNFLFFNEAFLCINYSLGGLSAGSKKNAGWFGMLGFVYLVLFLCNLFFAPSVFRFLMNMSAPWYTVGYAIFSLMIAWLVLRLMPDYRRTRRVVTGFAIAIVLFAGASLFFPKEKILEKAATTRYRIDVLTTPVEDAILNAYAGGETHNPVIRAAQNQWFINTFIDEENNPFVSSAGFRLLQHAPQSKGARYNAQATDLVASRFLVAEHGKWAVLLFTLLILLPGIMLASYYKLYPDFTNRVNNGYPYVTIGFSVLNYILITTLLVILAATGRYIFFGQDLPFASILSKQSILFPAILLLALVALFKKLPAEQYENRRKWLPGVFVLLFMALLLVLFRPAYNRNREFDAGGLAATLQDWIDIRVQPLLDHIDSSSASKRLSIAEKDRLFTDTLRRMIETGTWQGEHRFFTTQLSNYARSGLSSHLDQRRILYLDLYSGRPKLAVNENYFRVDPPPHLRQLWKGNVYGDTSVYNITVWQPGENGVWTQRVRSEEFAANPVLVKNQLELLLENDQEDQSQAIRLTNRGEQPLSVIHHRQVTSLSSNESLVLSAISRVQITGPQGLVWLLSVEPDAFMKNYYVNGNRLYHYPMKEDFTWAKNFAEAIAPDFIASDKPDQHTFLSLDFELMDSLSAMIKEMMLHDPSYKAGAEYGICIADAEGRVLAMADHIKDFYRPDPNDRAAFNRVVQGEEGMVSQALLRKQIGNINLLRMNPGPGSTFKPIVFSAIASQLDWNWDGFAAEGFDGKQKFFGGEKVPEYDFEKNNGRINSVSDYLKYSDNYYHANVLLLGSYPRQRSSKILSGHFMNRRPGSGVQWPSFTYTGKQYWLNGFENWPGFEKGRANFGTDSSFTSIGLLNNFDIYNRTPESVVHGFASTGDSILFRNAWRRSGFILPEYSLFDQWGALVDHRIPYDLFTFCFRGHVKGSSQVMVSPLSMVESFGRLASQNRNYRLQFSADGKAAEFKAFDVDPGIPYNQYLGIIREKVFAGMREALFRGTAARLGAMLKNGSPYYYFAKTGTTGDDALDTKSKLLALIISLEDLSHPDHSFRNNKFVTVYFTSQNGPAKQNEEFQARVIKRLQEMEVFKNYMGPE